MTDPIQPADNWRALVAKEMEGQARFIQEAELLRSVKSATWNEGYRQAVTDIVGAQEEILDWQLEQNPHRSES